MNLAFDFSPRPVDPQREPVGHAPIAPSADLKARHCSSMGALHAEKSSANLHAAMVALYRIEPRSDAEIADVLSTPVRTIAPSTISARRKELIEAGIVARESCGTRKNSRTGVSNTLWQLKQ